LFFLFSPCFPRPVFSAGLTLLLKPASLFQIDCPSLPVPFFLFPLLIALFFFLEAPSVKSRHERSFSLCISLAHPDEQQMPTLCLRDSCDVPLFFPPLVVTLFGDFCREESPVFSFNACVRPRAYPIVSSLFPFPFTPLCFVFLLEELFSLPPFFFFPFL